MYNLGNESLPGTSGVTALIPTLFIWPHGGREVFLSGSFTRWSEHLAMSPMEGCPTVFQKFYNLPPGYHQYKFLVDGEWRHDERQPTSTESYGIVNVMMLSEHDLVPAPVSLITPEAPGSRSSMDVDSEAFRRAVVLSDGILPDAIPRFSEADLKVSRDRISLFLSSHTAYELLPESGEVIALDVDLPVKQAFHILYDKGVSAAPLWDSSKGQFVGVLSSLDFILILRQLGNHGSHMTEEELETHTIYAWKEGKLNLNRQIGQNGVLFPRHLIQAGPSTSLKDISLQILHNGVSTVPIIHSSSQLLHITSLSDIIKCNYKHFRHSFNTLPIVQQPISSIPLGTWVPKLGESNRQPLTVLRRSASLASALSLLVEAQFSSIPIVNDDGSLVDMYSRSDITTLAKDRVYSQIHLDEISIHQALQLGPEANRQHFQLCLRSESLLNVIERMANSGVRRLIIVEAGSNRVEGIVSLSDVFRFLLG
ncbi:AMP-activated serine/threonine-protein kinase regulatory subunit [Ranunculus cassubicifolius]